MKYSARTSAGAKLTACEPPAVFGMQQNDYTLTDIICQALF